MHIHTMQTYKYFADIDRNLSAYSLSTEIAPQDILLCQSSLFNIWIKSPLSVFILNCHSTLPFLSAIQMQQTS